jgi:hypothetical protein
MTFSQLTNFPFFSLLTKEKHAIRQLRECHSGYGSSSDIAPPVLVGALFFDYYPIYMPLIKELECLASVYYKLYD